MNSNEKSLSKTARKSLKTVELIFEKDEKDELLDGGNYRYALRLEREKLLSIKSFWSVALYKLPEKSLVKNPKKKYLINSFMLPDLKMDIDGSLTIYLQKNYPGENRETNWLPTPEGPFLVILRLHWPEKEMVEVSWKGVSIKKLP